MNVTPKLILIRLINFVSGVVLLGLVIRFLLRLFGANPESDFVEFIYDSTSTLLEPFRGIFSPYVVEPGHVFEFSTLIAIVIYSIIAWLIIEFIEFIAYSASSSYRK